jgi:hypothetical protein
MKKHILIFCLLVSCSRAYPQYKNQVEMINLKYGFKLIGELNMEYDSSFRVYRKVTIFRNNVLMYSDSTGEFERFSAKIPQVHTFKSHAFGILLESFKAPSKNRIQYILFQKDKILRKENLPLFFTAKKNLDKDDYLEVAGVWDYFQTSHEGLMSYEPVIYYEFAQKGIVLDKSLTIKKNKEIYGKFYGYDVNEKIKFPIIKVWKKLHKEIRILERKK